MIARALAALALVGVTAASTPGLRAGLWEVRSAPTAATLDGKPLADLPYAPPPPERVCLTAAQAAAPATWLSRDMPAECKVTAAKMAGGRADIRATCAPKPRDVKAGTMRLTGRWTAENYDLRFETISHGENGRMGFNGTMTGRRVGDCPG